MAEYSEYVNMMTPVKCPARHLAQPAVSRETLWLVMLLPFVLNSEYISMIMIMRCLNMQYCQAPPSPSLKPRLQFRLRLAHRN